jgi:hypothetical protein
MEPGEVLVDSRYTTKQGATVIIKNVPTRFVKDDLGQVHEANSIRVAMRLEELTNRALEADSSPGVVHELEF